MRLDNIIARICDPRNARHKPETREQRTRGHDLQDACPLDAAAHNVMQGLHAALTCSNILHAYTRSGQSKRGSRIIQIDRYSLACSSPGDMGTQPRHPALPLILLVPPTPLHSTPSHPDTPALQHQLLQHPSTGSQCCTFHLMVSPAHMGTTTVSPNA